MIQLTFKGENILPHYSPIFNKLVYSKKYSKQFENFQIFELDLASNKERRITFNLGDNFNAHFHPYKSWIAYSSSTDEKLEKLPIHDLLKEYGLETPGTSVKEIGHEIYVSSLDSTDIKRLTKEVGLDGIPVFSTDGTKVYYLKKNANVSQILTFDLTSGRKSVVISQKDPIENFHVNADAIAILSHIADQKSELKILSLKKISEVKYQNTFSNNLKDLYLHKTKNSILISMAPAGTTNYDIYQLDFDANCITRFTKDSAQDVSPVYGNEAKAFIFSSNRNNNEFQIFTMAIPLNATCSPLNLESK